ncbi:MAG: hypothetical protein B6U89_04690 [Desulfurococcales archaeon ex4484_58]|nr:MAG: hypothetical protein B6U89_04690 [Desulfurococcales archaeon ex4484_58]
MGYGPPWRWHWGRGGRGRRPKPRHIWFTPRSIAFIPFNELGEPVSNEPIYLMPDEVEALRLVYFEGFTQEEAANKMNISRGTLWRILANGRKKLVQAIVEVKPIILLPPTKPPSVGQHETL